MNARRLALLSLALAAAAGAGWIGGSLTTRARAEAETIAHVWINAAVAAADQQQGQARPPAQVAQVVNDTLVAETLLLQRRLTLIDDASLRRQIASVAQRLQRHPETLQATLLHDRMHLDARGALACIARAAAGDDAHCATSTPQPPSALAAR